MGYSYSRSVKSGAMLLDCDNCGANSHDNNGPVRKRVCTFKVSDRGVRGHPDRALPYCYPPALCRACFDRHGGSKGVHAECAEGAAASQARYDAQRARLDAGDGMVIWRERQHPGGGNDYVVVSCYLFGDGTTTTVVTAAAGPDWWSDLMQIDAEIRPAPAIA